MKNSLLLVLIASTLLCFEILGQGNYEPIGADLSYPRTIIDSEEIPLVKESLNSPLKSFLFEEIIEFANLNIPSGNNSNSDRRRRSQISREAAFIFLMDRQIENSLIVPLNDSDSLFYLNRTIDLLENLNDSVGYQEGWSFYWEWQLRSKELIHYLVAYDLLKGAGVSDSVLNNAKLKLQNFAGNLYKRSIDFYPNPAIPAIPLEFYSYNPNNHAIITSTTLGVAAIVLGDMESDDENYRPASWINAAMWNLDNTLWKENGIIPRVSDSTRFVGYSEGPNYFGYCFNNAMIFIRSMWNFLPDDYHEYTFYDYNALSGQSQIVTRNIRNPWYNESFQNLYEWLNRIRMPDGRFPAIHDSSRGFKSMLPALSGNPRYNIYYSDSDYNSIWMRSQYISTLIDFGVYDESLFQALPEAGSLVFRSEYLNEEALYMHLIGKNGIALAGAKAHHQSDATSFQLYFNGEDLALDPGYSGSNYREDVEKSTDHNLILVNGDGPGEPVSEWIDVENTTYIENYFDMPHIDYGELRSGWNNANITRKVLFLNNQYFIITDFIRSNTLNDYTFQLHGHGIEDGDSTSTSGAFEPKFSNFGGIYKRNNANLLAHITSRGTTTYESVLDSLSLGASGYQEYSKLLAHENSSKDTEFTSIMFPYKNGEQPLIENILTNESVNAQAIFTNYSKDLIFVSPNNDLVEIPTSDNNFSQDVKGNGNINFISFDNTDTFKYLFIENGSNLKVNDLDLFLSDELVDIVFETNEEGDISGFISRPTTIKIHSEVPLITEYGNISFIEYDSINNKSIITFEDQTYFKLISGELTSTSSFISNPLQFDLIPNPAKNSTSILINNSNINLSESVITIYDLHGKVVLEETPSSYLNNNLFNISLNGINQGIYYISIKLQNSVFLKPQKLVVLSP